MYLLVLSRNYDVGRGVKGGGGGGGIVFYRFSATCGRPWRNIHLDFVVVFCWLFCWGFFLSFFFRLLVCVVCFAFSFPILPFSVSAQSVVNERNGFVYALMMAY